MFATTASTVYTIVPFCWKGLLIGRVTRVPKNGRLDIFCAPKFEGDNTVEFTFEDIVIEEFLLKYSPKVRFCVAVKFRVVPATMSKKRVKVITSPIDTVEFSDSVNEVANHEDATLLSTRIFIVLFKQEPAILLLPLGKPLQVQISAVATRVLPTVMEG